MEGEYKIEKSEDKKEGFNIRMVARLKNARLVGAREMLGLTGRGLAEQLDISQMYYYHIENMIAYPGIKLKTRICDFFRQRGVFLFEDDVFPEELRTAIYKKRKTYVFEKTIPREKLLSLSEVRTKMLPVIQSEVENIVEYHNLTEEVGKVLESLNYRERQIVRMRYGLNPEGKQYTLEEVGLYFNISGNRAGQIEARALRKLQHPARSEKLEKFLGCVFSISPLD